MPVRVKARAVIWVGDRVVVHSVVRNERLHVTLPGGRVNERESVIEALHREVQEEIGLEIEIGDLLFAAEVIAGASRQDVELVFEARPRGSIDGRQFDLVDPADEASANVLPPVLGELARRHQSPAVAAPRWLGNLYVAGGSRAMSSREPDRGTDAMR
jgi:ADP-ribose pyrophosphatase YjhB (NUDIX family)